MKGLCTSLVLKKGGGGGALRLIRWLAERTQAPYVICLLLTHLEPRVLMLFSHFWVRYSIAFVINSSYRKVNLTKLIQVDGFVSGLPIGVTEYLITL